jgi:hypothetical protein
MCWNYIFQQHQPGQRLRQIWHQTVYQGLLPIFKELALSTFHWQEMVQLYQTYWRLHLFPQQPDVANSLKRSEWLSEAIELFVLELESHELPIPEWLFDLIPTFSPMESFSEASQTETWAYAAEETS